MKSIIQNDKKCYICHTTSNIHDHHIFYGLANRKLSEKHGLKVWLCGYHHNLNENGVHGKNGHKLDLYLKEYAQKKFEETHTRQEFMNIFGKNYL